MARLIGVSLAVILFSMAATGCVGDRSVQAYSLVHTVTVEGDGSFLAVEGPHCPRFSRVGDGFHYDRVWGDPIPETLLYEEWSGPGYLQAGHMGSDHKGSALGTATIRATADAELTLATISVEKGTLLLDGVPVVLPWNMTYQYPASNGTLQVTETLVLEDEAVRPLSVSSRMTRLCE